MRQFLREIRFAITDAWKSRGGRKLPVDDSLARTLKESSHVTRGGGNSSAPSNKAAQIMADGAENYTKSFKNDGAS